MQQQLSRLHGVTLVDLMITVSIVSILGIMSFSTLPDMLNRYRANTIVESYIRAVHAAREAAVSRQVLTTVCPSRCCDHLWQRLEPRRYRVHGRQRKQDSGCG